MRGRGAVRWHTCRAGCWPTLLPRAALGKCSKRGMALVPEGTRFGLLRHMFASPWHITAMVVIMILIMAAIMMLVR